MGSVNVHERNPASVGMVNAGARPRVVISGWYGHNNVGDDAILDVLIVELSRRLGRCSFTVITDAVSSPRIEPQCGCEVRWLPHRSPYRFANARNPGLWPAFMRCWSAVATCDLFVLGGGGLLRDNFPRSNQLRLLDDVLLARLAGRPAVLFAIGAGPFVTSLGRRLARTAVRLARSASVRDEASAESLRSIGVPGHRFCVVGDPALLLTACPDIAPLPSGNRMRVAICPSHGMLTGFAGGAPGNPRLLEILSRTADLLVEQLGAEIWLVPFCRVSAQDDDLPLCRRIRDGMKHAADAQVVTSLDGPSQTKAFLGRMHAVIGGRLHALILAAPQGVACVGINYEPKVRGFMREMGLDASCLDPLEFSENRVVGLVRDLVETADARRRDATVRADAARDKTRTALDVLADLARGSMARRMGMTLRSRDSAVVPEGVHR